MSKKCIIINIFCHLKMDIALIYPVWLGLIYCARPSHTDRHFVYTASCVKTTFALPTKKLGCQEIETNISSVYEN